MPLIGNYNLPPTKMNFDLWVADKDRDKLIKKISRHYGVPYDVIDQDVEVENMVITMTNVKKNKCGQYISILMILEPEVEASTIVHECYHVLCHLSLIIGAETTGNGEEWSAYMIEYIFETVTKALQK